MLVSVLKVNNIDFGPRFCSCPAEHYNMLYSSPIYKHLCCIVLGSLGCCPFQGGGSVVAFDLLFIVLPIVCGSSLFVFVCYALLCVHSSFAIILKRKRELVCFVFIVLQMSCDCKCSVALPQDAVGWSAVCDCGIS